MQVDGVALGGLQHHGIIAFFPFGVGQQVPEPVDFGLLIAQFLPNLVPPGAEPGVFAVAGEDVLLLPDQFRGAYQVGGGVGVLDHFQGVFALLVGDPA